MKDQHKLIKGYRELSQNEIDLMNRIKAKGGELLALQAELAGKLREQAVQKMDEVDNGLPGAKEELQRFSDAEPMHWVSIGKTDIQTGIMALVRAVAQPEHC